MTLEGSYAAGFFMSFLGKFKGAICVLIRLVGMPTAGGANALFVVLGGGAVRLCGERMKPGDLLV
jgi:hypothetical protein